MPDSGGRRGAGASREEIEVWHEHVRNALSHVGFPATKGDLARHLEAVTEESPLSRASVRALPDRVYESPADVRYTLEALGAFPGSGSRP